MQPHAPSTLIFLLLIPLLAWRLYRRFKRMVGRQRLTKARPWVTLVIFPLLTLMLAAASRSEPLGLELLSAGLLGGVLLGAFAITKTRFEATEQGFFYTPNAHLGLAISLLFLGRIAYRLVQVFSADPQALQHGSNGLARSPLTLGMFGLLAGYFVAYAIGLLRQSARTMPAKPGS